MLSKFFCFTMKMIIIDIIFFGLQKFSFLSLKQLMWKAQNFVFEVRQWLMSIGDTAHPEMTQVSLGN